MVKKILLTAGFLALPSMCFADTLSINPTLTGWALNSDADYTTSHDAIFANGQVSWSPGNNPNNNSEMDFGYNGFYTEARDYLVFDTSGINPSATINSWTLTMCDENSDGGVVDTTALTKVTMLTDTGVDITDFNITNFGSEVASRVNFSDQPYTGIPSSSLFNFVGTDMSAIVKGGVTHFGMLTGRDLDNTGAVLDFSQRYYGEAFAGNCNSPVLTINYSLPDFSMTGVLLTSDAISGVKAGVGDSVRTIQSSINTNALPEMATMFGGLSVIGSILGFIIRAHRKI